LTTLKSNPAFGQNVKQSDIDKLLLTGPGEELVDKLLLQLSAVPGFQAIFGPYKLGSESMRWANYQRMDWSMRQLPVMNVYESGTEDKDSDEAYLRGSLMIQVMWPPNTRRAELARLPAAFKGAIQNFFNSDFCSDMLDELYYIQRPMKVNGLNELGKVLNWTPNTEGMVETEMVPVTILEVRYRIDLRSWRRTLEFQDRTKTQPFEKTLYDLAAIGGISTGEIDGYTDDIGEGIQVAVKVDFKVNNP
jgi:hypothetical protein